MSRWTHPICEACWIDTEGNYERNEELDAEVLVSVRQPARIVNPPDEPPPPVERCCWCCAPTIVGIYKRHDPADLKNCAHIDGSPDAHE